MENGLSSIERADSNSVQKPMVLFSMIDGSLDTGRNTTTFEKGNEAGFDDVCNLRPDCLRRSAGGDQGGAVSRVGQLGLVVILMLMQLHGRITLASNSYSFRFIAYEFETCLPHVLSRKWTIRAGRKLSAHLPQRTS